MKLKHASSAEIDAFMEELRSAAETDLLPKMKASAFVIGTGMDEPDVYLALQIGLALLLEKPLVLMVQKETWIPPRLRALADLVLEMNPPGGDQRAAGEALMKWFQAQKAKEKQ
jgi:hypothetical protein